MSELIRVLVADKLSDEATDFLSEEKGFKVDKRPGLSPAELRDIVGSYEAILLRSGATISQEIIDNAPNLKLVGRAGIGVDNVDVAAASKAGIVVMNTPSGNTVTTAEHAISLLLAVARKIPQAHLSMKEGRWDKAQFKGQEIHNKVLGILGLGNIGREVALRARGLQMKVVAFDPVVTPEKAASLGVTLLSFDDFLATSDFISVHTPLIDATRHILDAKAFAKMKRGALLVHAARGGIVDEKALVAALDSGQLGGAALDVFEEEPPPKDSPLRHCNNLILTPHLGASTHEAQSRVAIQIAEQTYDFFKTNTVRNAVNAPNLAKETLESLTPHMYLSQLLGSFLAQYATDQASEITVTLTKGSLNKADTAPIMHAAVAGYISAKQGRHIDWLLAPARASEYGIKVIESYCNENDAALAPSICVKAKTSKGKVSTVSGTLFADKGPRITQINDANIEVTPSANLVVLENDDTPGVIGNVGTFFGQKKVNVSRMQLGASGKERAISVWSLSRALSKDESKALEQIPSVFSAKSISLQAQ